MSSVYDGLPNSFIRGKWFCLALAHFLIHHFEAVTNSKKLQTTTEMWLLKDFKIRLHRKHCGKR